MSPRRVAGDHVVGHSGGGLRGTVVAVAVILLLLVAVLPGVAAADTGDCTVSGAYEVCFNDPTGPALEENVIVDRLKELAREAQSGDRIDLTAYTWTVTGIANVLAAANDSGAEVRVVLDDKSEANTPYAILNQAGIPVTVCDLSCTSQQTNSVQHNKFFWLDVGGVESLVITSSNLTMRQKRDRYNDLVTIRNDAQLHGFFGDYWNRLDAQSWTFAGDRWTDTDRERAGDLATRGYVFERDDRDVVADILNDVSACRRGDAKIWLSVSSFTASRAAIQQRLEELENLGCNVKAIIARSVDEAFVQKGTSWNNNDPRTYLTKSKVRQMPGQVVDVHHKLMLIDAEYDGRFQEVVFTGSHNFNGRSLRKHDEDWVRVEDGFVFSQYRRHFDELYSRSTD